MQPVRRTIVEDKSNRSSGKSRARQVRERGMTGRLCPHLPNSSRVHLMTFKLGSALVIATTSVVEGRAGLAVKCSWHRYHRRDRWGNRKSGTYITD